MTDIHQIKVENRAVDDIHPYELNAKEHSEDQVKKLAESILRDGFSAPISVDRDGVIIAGHGRFEAIKHLGWEHVPVVVRDDITAVQAKRLRIADNKLSSDEWNDKLLGLDLQDIMGEDDSFDIGDLFLDESEIDVFRNLDTEIDDSVLVDDVADAVEKQKQESDERAEEIRADEVALSRIFGTAKVTTDQEFTLKQFIMLAEGETEKEGIEAVADYIENTILRCP